MFPLFTTRCLHIHHDVRDSSSRSGNWTRMLSGNFAEMTTFTPFRDLLHAANLRHGTDSFTSAPKEGVLRIFSPLQIRQLRPGLNLRTWVLKASTLPLDHRSRCVGCTPSKLRVKVSDKILLYIQLSCHGTLPSLLKYSTNRLLTSFPVS